jgi:hypothetical protein
VRGTLTPDHYRTLQVEPSAGLEAIHAAYRRLARLYHPDLNPSPEAAARMRAINAAYRVLSDPRRRAEYDAQRFLRPASVTATGVRPRTRPVVVASPPEPPSDLQRRVDRIVAVLGILLIIGIGLYAVLVIPRAEQQFQGEVRGTHPPVPTLPARSTGTDENVPARLRNDSGLRSFPGTVLVPPTTLAPFKDLPIMRLDATSQGIARYAVYYGDITTGVADISGLIGRASFDAAAPRLPNCAPDATYCTGPGVGQSSSDSPGIELFRPLHLVGDDEAFATHRVCCNGVFWSLSWYDPATNMSYTIDLSRNIAAQFGSASANDDVDAARTVGALAGQLVRLP